MKKEKGNILISVLLFVSLSSVMISGIAVATRNQVVQLRQTQDSYYARSMIAMTTTILQKKAESGEILEPGQIVFTEGAVLIQRINPEEVELNAVLKNNFSTKIVIKHPIVNDEEDPSENEEELNELEESENDPILYE